jgi:ketosteroid isomerase-like protein
MRSILSVSAVVLVTALPLSAQSPRPTHGATPAPSATAAPRVATSFSAADQRELDDVRRGVWVAWFGGDTASLRRVLGPELLAMDGGGTSWRGLEPTIASSADFAARGGKLVSVRFDSATTHRFGNVAVMFSLYALETESNGARSASHGRATEVFVRTAGRWVHTSWQLERLADPPKP